MKIFEILAESSQDEIKQDLKQLFIPYLAQDKGQVSMKEIIQKMNDMHGSSWDVTPEWIMSALAGESFISQITPEKIELVTSTPQHMQSHHRKQDAKDHVKKMAKKNLKK